MPTPRRHYFLVADQIGHEVWDNDVLAMVIRLMSHLHERWARDGLTPEEASTCVIGRGDLLRITGAKRADYGKIALAKLPAILTLAVSFDGDSALLTWPKFAKFQGLPTRNPPEQNRNPPPPDPVPEPEPEPDKKKISGAKNAGVSRTTWLTPFGEVWKEHYGGDLAYKQAAAALSPRIRELGSEEVLVRWRRYCEQTSGTFASVSRFAQTITTWNGKESPVLRPMSSTSGNLTAGEKSMQAVRDVAAQFEREGKL